MKPVPGAIPEAAGGEGGHGAAKPDGVIHRYRENPSGTNLVSLILRRLRVVIRVPQILEVFQHLNLHQIKAKRTLEPRHCSHHPKPDAYPGTTADFNLTLGQIQCKSQDKVSTTLLQINSPFPP
jgi:hypothetical protein